MRKQTEKSQVAAESVLHYAADEKMLKAIIFDCDGVIADTEVHRLRHLKRLAEEKGYSGIDEEKHLKHLIGNRSKDLLRTVFGEKMSEEIIEEVVSRRHREFAEKPHEHIIPKKGIREVCEKLSEKYELAVASTAPRKLVEATIRHMGIEKYFKVIVTGSEVKQVKPNPEVYLKAVQGLGRKGEECIAIEDSETGIAAAKAAGIKVVALRNKMYEEHGFKPDLSKADILIDELLQVLKIVL